MNSSSTESSSWRSAYDAIVPVEFREGKQLRGWRDAAAVIETAARLKRTGGGADAVGELSRIASRRLMGAYARMGCDSLAAILRVELSPTDRGVGRLTAIEHGLAKAFVEQSAAVSPQPQPKPEESVLRPPSAMPFAEFRQEVMPEWPHVSVSLVKWGDLDYVRRIKSVMDGSEPSWRFKALKEAVSTRLAGVYAKMGADDVESALALDVRIGCVAGAGRIVEQEHRIVAGLLGPESRIAELADEVAVGEAEPAWRGCESFPSLLSFLTDVADAQDSDSNEGRCFAILCARMGFGGAVPTYDELGRIHGISHQRLFSLEKRAEGLVFGVRRGRLAPLEDFVLGRLRETGYCFDLQELAASVDARFGWSGTDPKTLLALLRRMYGREMLTEPEWRRASSDPMRGRIWAFGFDEHCSERFVRVAKLLVSARSVSMSRESVARLVAEAEGTSVHMYELEYYVRAFLGSGRTFGSKGRMRERVQETKAMLEHYFLRLEGKPEAAVREDAVLSVLAAAGSYGMTAEEIVARVNEIHPELRMDEARFRSVVSNCSPSDPGSRIVVAQKGAKSKGRSRYALLGFFNTEALAETGRRAAAFLERWMSENGLWVCCLTRAYVEFSREIPHWCTERNFYDVIRENCGGLCLPKHPRVFLNRAARDRAGENCYFDQVCDYFSARGMVTVGEDKVLRFLKELVGVPPEQVWMVIGTFPRVSLAKGSDILLEKE